jgi:hypothetical protein
MFSKEGTEYLQCLELATGIRKIIFCKQKNDQKLCCVSAVFDSTAAQLGCVC